MSGWKMVPVECADEMLESAGPMDGYGEETTGEETTDEDHREWYRGVIDAAPSPWRPIEECEPDRIVLLWFPSNRIKSRVGMRRDFDIVRPTHFIDLSDLGEPA